MRYEVVCADVLEWSLDYEGEKFHAMLCDPPYELAFMGKDWDRSGIAFDPTTWAELAEHLHPGGFLMAFASSRGWHRLACALEDAGLVFHPSVFMLGWVQGQGFPKATRIGKNGKHPEFEGHRYGLQALKPALEPILVAQKPYAGRPVDSITATGAGALWIDGGRVGTDTVSTHGYPGEDLMGAMKDNCVTGKPDYHSTSGRWPPNAVLCHLPGCQRAGVRRVKPLEGHRPNPVNVQSDGRIKFNEKPKGYQKTSYTAPDGQETVARWLCEPGCPAAELAKQSGERRSGGRTGTYNGQGFMDSRPSQNGKAVTPISPSQGTATRFFPNFGWQAEVSERLAGVTPFRYQAKASRRERDAGLEKTLRKQAPKRSGGPDRRSGTKRQPTEWRSPKVHNFHPTVKPIALARWLATLLLPPPEYAPRRILIPFCGTMSEGIGALQAGWDVIVGIDSVEEYCEIAEARLNHWAAEAIQPELL